MTDAFTPPPAAAPDPEPTLRDLWGRLRRQWPLIVGTLVAVVGLVTLWTFTTEPIYRSTVRVQVITEGTDLPGMEDLTSLPGLELSGFSEGELETEMGILRSRRILEAVVDSLALQVRVEKPTRRRDEVLRVLAVDDPDLDLTLALERTDGERWRVRVRNLDGGDVDPASVPAEVAVGEAFRVGRVTLALAEGLLADPPDRIEIEMVPQYEALSDLEDDLDIRRQEGGSRLIEVSYRSPDRVMAAGVVNTAVQEYVAYRTSTETSDIVQRATELRRQVTNYADSLAAAEERLREYQVRERVVAPEEEAIQQVERLGELQVSIDALDVERQALRDLLVVIDERSPGDGPRAYRQLATFPTFISNGAIQDILQSLVELENERAELLGQRTEANRDVVRIDRRIEELEGQLYRLGSEYLESLDHQYVSASRSRAAIAEQLEALPERGMRYGRLIRDQEILGEAYLRLQQQLKQAEIREALYTDNIRVVDFGRISHPDDPAFPKPIVNLLLAFVLGLTAALALALVRDMWDDRIRGEMDALRAGSGLPVVGVIPASRRIGRHAGSNGGVLPARRRGGPVPVAEADPWSEPAEAYRSMAMQMASPNGERPGRVIVVTSEREGEGASAVAANLAIAFAQQGRRTLLVDGDVREGTLHTLLDAQPGPGLRQLLAGEGSFGDLVQEVELAHGPSGLGFVPSGGGASHPPGMVDREVLDGVLREMRSGWECVVIDTAPLERSSGTSGLSARADGVLVVARMGVTDRDQLQRTVSRLRRVSDRVEGIVLAEGEGTVRLRGD